MEMPSPRAPPTATATEMDRQGQGQVLQSAEDADADADGGDGEGGDADADSEVVGALNSPIFRLVRRDDPEAYQFNSTRYSAHKLPKDVVDASRSPGGVDARELLDQWKRVMEGRDAGDDDDEETSGGR